MKSVIKVPVVPFIDAIVIPGENSDPDNLGFTFNAEFIDSKSVKISIEWENPLLVSTDPLAEDIL